MKWVSHVSVPQVAVSSRPERLARHQPERGRGQQLQGLVHDRRRSRPGRPWISAEAEERPVRRQRQRRRLRRPVGQDDAVPRQRRDGDETEGESRKSWVRLPALLASNLFEMTLWSTKLCLKALLKNFFCLGLIVAHFCLLAFSC